MLNQYDNHNLVAEYGAWLRSFSWDVFGTLTFDPGRSRHSSLSRQKTLSSYLSSLERHCRAHVRCFWAEEMRWSGCGLPGIAPHFHVLLACDRHHLNPVHPALLWEHLAGRTDMRVYDPSRNGAEYCAKLIGHPNANYGFVNFTRPTRISTSQPPVALGPSCASNAPLRSPANSAGTRRGFISHKEQALIQGGSIPVSTATIETPVEVSGSTPGQEEVKLGEQIIPGELGLDHGSGKLGIGYNAALDATALKQLTEKKNYWGFLEGKDAALYLRLLRVSAPTEKPIDIASLQSDEVKTTSKKGGRPRKYLTPAAQRKGHAERQRRYRARKLLVVADVTKTPSQVAER